MKQYDRNFCLEHLQTDHIHITKQDTLKSIHRQKCRVYNSSFPLLPVVTHAYVIDIKSKKCVLKGPIHQSDLLRSFFITPTAVLCAVEIATILVYLLKF